MPPDPDTLLAVLEDIVLRVRRDVSAVKNPDGSMYRSDDALTRTRLIDHLQSRDGGAGRRRGAYLIKPGSSVCRAAVFDLDDHDNALPWENLARAAEKLIRQAGKYGLRGCPWSSSSGHGIHIWFLWDGEQDAYTVRQMLTRVAKICGFTVGTEGAADGQLEIYPKQDAVVIGGYGNQVWLPLAGKSAPLAPDFIDNTLRPVPLSYLASGGWFWPVSDDLEKIERPAGEVADIAGVGGAVATFDPAALGGKLSLWRDWLSYMRDYSYTAWTQVGMALHHASAGAPEALALWENWSAAGTGFEVGACAAKWVSFDKGGEGARLGEGSLRLWASEGGWSPVNDKDFENFGITATSGGLSKDPIKCPLPAFERNEDGRIKATTDNLMLALSHGEHTGFVVGIDSFRDELMIKDVRGAAPENVRGKWRVFTDIDYTGLKCALENKGAGMMPIPRLELRECVAAVAARGAFDSAADWLQGLQWDGKGRVGTFLETYWGTEASDYTKAVSLYMWTALAGRVMEPGCQVDMVPILVGEEGAGKSSTIRSLAPWDAAFCEVSFAEKDDDTARKLRGVLAVEIAELRGLGTRDEESIYTFVTRRVEKWVPKFKEFSYNFGRRCVLFGTVNDPEFLGKEGRRWLPFNVGARAGRSDEGVRPDLVARDRNQLWAEALVLWKQGGVAFAEAERLGKEARAAFVMTHPWEDLIKAWITDYGAVVGLGAQGGGFTSAQIFEQALGLGGRTTGADGRNLARVMTRLGYVRSTGAGNPRVWAKR